MTETGGSFARHAIYWVPEPGSALARIGASWLGVDVETGEPAPAIEPEGLPEPRARLVREARRYGFHGTLKAPFRLAEGTPPEVLDGATAALAARHAPVTLPGLRVDVSMGFACLMPAGPVPGLDALAAACVTELDLCRAPSTAAELPRRRRAGLDMVEDAHLRAWGYPWVLDRFRFHVTLTCPLSRMELRQAAPILEDLFAPALDGPLRIAALAVVGDPGGAAPFRVLRRHPLRGEGAIRPA